MSNADLAMVLECERRIVNAWPAPATLLIGDWVVRFANGYSGRANAASPIAIGAELDDECCDFIEQLYRGDGLPPCIRLTPLVAEATRDRIIARGYRVRDASFGLVAALDTVEPMVAADIEYTPLATEEWIAGVAARQTGAKANAAHLAAIVEKVRMPAAFAALMIGGEPVAYGMSVAERGMAEIGSIVVDEAHRGQGLGRRIVTGLMSWARAMACHSAYLQVDQSNAVALRLYENLGYRRLYAYETRVVD